MTKPSEAALKAAQEIKWRGDCDSRSTLNWTVENIAARIDAAADAKYAGLVAAAGKLTTSDIDRYEGADEVGECHFCGKRNYFGEQYKAGCELQTLRDALRKIKGEK